jgi:hypothetical protein
MQVKANGRLLQRTAFEVVLLTLNPGNPLVVHAKHCWRIALFAAPDGVEIDA